MDLFDREEDMKKLQEKYIKNIAGKVRAAFANTSARSVFVGSGWSTLSLLSPALWRKWDKPVLEAIIRAAHESGGLVHHHFHGRCLGVLQELADLGLDCICPFERPPGGDVTDLAVVREALENKTTFNGNVHTVESLIRGTPADVQREVLEILEVFSGSPRLIVGTGDQVGAETPDENIYAMIEAVHQYRK
jgi:uroporphyrinogen-III decarboxylase